MLRNIPNRYCQAQLLDEIDGEGFDGTYDFFYLPMDTHNRTNVGYAFINFTLPATMQNFIAAFSGYRFKDHSSQKVAKVSPAHLQGFHENVQHFSNRAVTHSRNCQYRPVVVIDGQRMDLNDAVEKFFPGGCEGPEHGAGDGGFEEHSGFDHTAEELVPSFLTAEEPEAVAWLPPSPQKTYPVAAEQLWAQAAVAAAAPFSFKIDKTGLEEAVSKWLQVEAAGEETCSTEGDQTPGASRRSSSPEDAKSKPLGIWELPAVADPPAYQSTTPRTNYTLLWGAHGRA